MSKQILITGGAGFIGSHVADELLAQGHRVRALDVLSPQVHPGMHAVEDRRQHLLQFGVWGNKPVPLFPYPGSPDYTRLWGVPDEQAWERAHAHYLANHVDFSDVQDAHPRPLGDLEHPAHAR